MPNQSNPTAAADAPALIRSIALCLCVATAALPINSGCSLVAVRRPPSEPEKVFDEGCTDGFTYPALDAVAAVLGGVLAVGLLTASGNEGARDDDPALRGAGYGSIAIASLFLASAAYGSIFVNRCRRVKTEAGVVRPARDLVIDRPPPGTRGGPCLEDGSCEGDLICDPPMKVCIPLEPTDEDM